MKNINIIAILTFLMIASCSKVDQSKIENVQSNLLAESRTTEQNMVYKKTDYGYLFYKPTDSTFYFVQTNINMALEGDYKFVASGHNYLKIQSKSTNEMVEYQINESNFGIGEMRGEGYNDLFLDFIDGSIIFTNDDDVNELSCKCQKDGSSKACDQGGEGSSACSVTDGGSTPVLGWNNECSVTCKDGYYSCCNELKIEDNGN